MGAGEHIVDVDRGMGKKIIALMRGAVWDSFCSFMITVALNRI